MCGIYGVFDRLREPIDAGLLARMDASLVHRGPDDTGVFVGQGERAGVAIGNRRLSIIDVAGGKQPFVSDDGRIAVVQNGEIFNFVELQAELAQGGVVCTTQSDTEVLLRLYERHGIAFVEKLNGMFAIAIVDDVRGECHLVRDRVGVKPLYVWDDGRRIVFASEIKALLPWMGKPRVDLLAVHHFLSFNYVPPPLTAFQGVRHVMPGHVMTLRSGVLSATAWWSLSDQLQGAYPQQSQAAWAEEFLDILDDATRIRLRADVPFGAFLSGGVDSSTVVGLMQRHTPQPVRTFCIGFDDPRFDESAHAQAIATRFGAHHTLEVAQLNMLSRWGHCLFHADQPHGDASFMPTLRVSELAAEHVKVVLTGDGGDELFAGYDKHAAFFANPHLSGGSAQDFAHHYADALRLFGDEEKNALYRPGLASQLRGVDSLRELTQPLFEEVSHWDRINQALYLDMQLLLPGNNLVKADRMGMAASLEARTPFLDWRMLRFACRSPGHTKLSGAQTKYWVRQAVAPLIGTDAAYRTKQMFTVPIGEWFKEQGGAWVRARLSAGGLLGELLERSQIERLLQQHLGGTRDRTRELRALCALSIWAERFEVSL